MVKLQPESGLDRMVSDLKDGIGRVASRRPALIDDTRRLVGFKPIDPSQTLMGGMHLLNLESKAAENDLVI